MFKPVLFLNQQRTLESRGIKVTFKKLVERINDKAENLIESLENPEEVYKYMIKSGIIMNNS